jgi:hypothetical protein
MKPFLGLVVGAAAVAGVVVYKFPHLDKAA